MNNICFVTYTHSNCEDLWKPYFDSLEEYASNIKSYVFSDKINNTHQKHKFILYENDKNYCQEFIKNLESIPEEYFIYMQEDFILYNSIDKKIINNYKDILSSSNISFIRLLKCGNVTNIKLKENLYFITEPGKNHNSINSFSMQPTIWKKKDFIQLYHLANNEKFGEYWENISAMNSLNMIGLYYYNGEKKIGIDHYESNIFPYIATAIVKGKWNTLEYSQELKKIFDIYKINPNIRGTNE